MIIRKVDTTDHVSKKRYIVQQWREFVKNEKHFIMCTKKLIQKTLWSRAF